MGQRSNELNSRAIQRPDLQSRRAWGDSTCLSSHCKQPVLYNHPCERPGHEKASRYRQKYVSTGDIYFAHSVLISV